MNAVAKIVTIPNWQCALELNAERKPTSGSAAALAAGIGRGADLRIYTEFRHNEHIDVTSANDELIEEVSEFAVTYLVENEWSAGIMSLRQPIAVPDGFGPRPSMSFFLYNQDGSQAIARPHLDGQPASGELAPSPPATEPGMKKYHASDSWDGQTNAPSTNFIYDFEKYRFYVRDDWRELLAHDSEGVAVSGSIDELSRAAAQGCQLKVAVRGLCADLDTETSREHELFVQTGPCYFYTQQSLLIAGSHPIVRVQPNIPMTYRSGNWDFGWLMLRTDGRVVYRRCEPYSLAFNDVEGRYGVRWFAR